MSVSQVAGINRFLTGISQREGETNTFGSLLSIA